MLRPLIIIHRLPFSPGDLSPISYYGQKTRAKGFIFTLFFKDNLFNSDLVFCGPFSKLWSSKFNSTDQLKR